MNGYEFAKWLLQAPLIPPNESRMKKEFLIYALVLYYYIWSIRNSTFHSDMQINLQGLLSCINSIADDHILKWANWRQNIFPRDIDSNREPRIVISRIERIRVSTDAVYKDNKGIAGLMVRNNQD
ncbi:hypothetical protein TorRG33x02_187460 [Trema orientale]|uniref:Uncharacterized protein n=1 Tax=Trema orientale TaxID=63057 RepID=A0A2P5EIU7_TREOI|nr:hypothetical protein TorRG33x02_187460 [Trema orientale]